MTSRIHSPLPEPRQVVVSLHGIRTRGEWQKTFAEVASAHQMIATSPDYGTLRIPGFLAGILARGRSEWFLREYARICTTHAGELSGASVPRYPSLVAHSFGTFIAARAMLKYEEIKFEHVLLCGSLLPRDFDWDRLFARDQVTALRHEYGLRDFPVRVASFLPHCGDSGTRGFDVPIASDDVEQEEYAEFRHSDFMSAAHMAHSWVPFLRRRQKRLVVRDGRKVQDREEFLRIAKQTGAIDEEVYGALPGFREIEASLDQAIAWYETEPEIYTFLIEASTGEYVGYVNAVLVRPDDFETIVSKGIEDRALSPDLMATTSVPGTLCMCILSIAVHPRVRNRGDGIGGCAAIQLIRGVAEKLEWLYKYRGIRVAEIAAVGWTPQGTRICRDVMRMPEVAKDRHGHPIFRSRLAVDALRGQHKPYRPLLRVAELYAKAAAEPGIVKGQ